jgi:hypothetical protein
MVVAAVGGVWLLLSGMVILPILGLISWVVFKLYRGE